VGSDALRAAIEAEGRARVATILRQAEIEADRLLGEASSDARRREEAAVRAREAELREEANERIARARAEARKRVLEARDELLDRVFAKAREAFARPSDDPSDRARLIARARDALRYMPEEGPIVFTCSEDAAPALESALADHERVAIERDPDLPSGFRATGANGAITVDATLTSLLDTNRPVLAIGVTSLLREGPERGPVT